MRPTLLYLCIFPEQRVCHLIHDGVRRYAASRKWDVEFLSWKEAKAGRIGDLARSCRPLGFVVECGDLPCTLPVTLFGGLPAVFVNYASVPRGKCFASIPIDNEAIAHAAFDELAKCHPAAYAVVDLRHAKGHWPTIRVKAFRAAAAKAKAHCHSFIFKDPKKEDVSGETERLSAWLAGLPRRTAIFAVNDLTSADVVEAARLARLRIPQDLLLLGVDNNLAVCEASKPALSSIQVDFENAGFQAAKTLGNILAAKNAKGSSASYVTAATRKVGRPKCPSRPRGPSSLAIGPLLAVRRESTRGFGRREPNILEAVEIIRREACDGLTAKALISRFPGSRWLFELRFREAMGHSVLDEILHVRLERVCTLLATTDMPIEAISDFCGFNSGRSLREHFLSHMKMSLREFRDKNRR